MDASIKTTLFLRDTPEVQMLAELLQLEFPTGRFVVGRVGGACSLLFDLEDHISPRQKNLLIDILRTLDSLLVETVYVRGRLGDEILKGYMGPERHSKEKSRKKLEEIKSQIEQLLPEHRLALRAMLEVD
jgi:diadenosine tetraphosphate (Ap4A) HIT family hydrolase